MSFPSLPLFAQNPTTTTKHTSSNGLSRALNNNNTSNSNAHARLNAYAHSVSITASSSSRIPSPNKPRLKSKSQSRPKAHHLHSSSTTTTSTTTTTTSTTNTTTDSRSKSKSNLKHKRSRLRMRVNRDIVPVPPQTDLHDEYLDDNTEDEETEGEAETDRDYTSGIDAAHASHTTLIVDPFSAEEERIITVLSRKLEQLRESETSTSTKPSCTVEVEKTPSLKQSKKRGSPPPIPGTLNGSAKKASPRSVDSGIYASSPSPTPSSPSSVYAAATSPIASRNGPAATNGKAKSNVHTTAPIAVNGSSTGNGHAKGKGHHHDDGGNGVGHPEFNNNTYSRTYHGAHVSTLSSPEMSLSASPCEMYDTRWMGATTGVNLNGTVNGVMSSFRREQEENQTQVMLQALMQENEELKSRIADVEGNYLRLERLNEAYREELIGYRTRLGLPVDNLIGLASDPLPSSLARFTTTSTYTRSQGPFTYHHHHHHPPSSSPLSNPVTNRHSFNPYTSYNHNNHINSNTTNENNNSHQYHHASSLSQSMSMLNVQDAVNNGRSDHGFGYGNGIGVNDGAKHATTGVPIPRPPSQVHANRHRQLPIPSTVDSLLRPGNEPQALLSTSVPSPSYASSPPYSSSYSAASSSAASSSAASSASASTNVTSPPSSLSFTMMMMLQPTLGVPTIGLTYPIVPPPSLSSSLGSGSWEGNYNNNSGNLSPVDPPPVNREGSLSG